MTDSGAEMAKPFVAATINVLSTMAQINPTPGVPYVKKDNMATGDVSAIIGFSGSKSGSISVSFEKQCAKAMVVNMLGDDVEDLEQDMKDAVGEISNMISGQARTGLTELGLTFQGSTPTVVMGDNHTITHITDSSIVVIPFTSDQGNFTVEFCLDS